MINVPEAHTVLLFKTAQVCLKAIFAPPPLLAKPPVTVLSKPVCSAGKLASFIKSCADLMCYRATM